MTSDDYVINLYVPTARVYSRIPILNFDFGGGSSLRRQSFFFFFFLHLKFNWFLVFEYFVLGCRVGAEATIFQ